MNSRPPGTRPLASRWIVGLAAIGWLSLVACGVWYEIGSRRQANFAAELAARALTLNGRPLRAALVELEHLGVVGVEPLVGLATSQRPDVATAAQETVSRMLISWEAAATERGDVQEFATQSQALAEALDEHAPRFGPPVQRWANQLAQRLVQHSDHFPIAESWEILASCDHVLSLPILRLEPKRRPPVAIATAAEAAPIVATPKPKPVIIEQPKPQPPTPVAPTAVVGRPLAEVTFVTPPVAVANASQRAAGDGNALRPPLRYPEEEAPAVAPTSGRVIDVPSPQEVRLQARAMRGLSSRALAMRVDETGPAEAAGAKKALRDRGITDDVLELTRHLESLPPVERREALQRASQLPPADARKVLRWFVTDADADVRLQALTILATTGDPKLGELARERAVEDADPRVAAFASELMRTR